MPADDHDRVPDDWRERVVLRPTQVAAMIDIHPSRLYRLMKEGKIPCRKVGGSLRVPVHDLRVLLGEIEG